MDKNYENALSKLDGEQPDSNKKGLEQLENAQSTSSIEKNDLNDKSNGLGKVGRNDYTTEKVLETNNKFGYFEIYIKDFPSKGLYYNDGIKVKIKSATVKEIRAFSSLDEDNPYEVDEALVDILSACVNVSYQDRVGSWKDLLEEDRLYLLLSIRELTFPGSENKISFKVKCESCGTENDMEIRNENFQKREVPEKIAKYYSKPDKGFNVETKSFGTIFIKPPTIGIMRLVSKYIKELQERKVAMKDYLPFLKVLPYMFNEWRGVTTNDLENLRVEFTRWNEKRFLTFNSLCEVAQVSVKEKMLVPCKKCGDPIEADVQLPTGIKGLFIEQDILGDELI